MKAVTKITFYDEQGDKFFGEGPCRLLRAVEEAGSLHAAALSMGMAYTKAMKLLKTAERALGFPLTARTTGGRAGDRPSAPATMGLIQTWDPAEGAFYCDDHYSFYWRVVGQDCEGDRRVRRTES